MDYNKISLKEKNESSKNSRLLSMNNIDDKKKKSFKLEKFDIEILSNESFDLQNNKLNSEDNLNLVLNSKSSLSKKDSKIRRIFSFNDNGIPAKLHLYSYKLNLVDYYDYVYRNYSKYFWYKRCMELQSELRNSNSRSRENYLTNNLILAQKNYHSFNSKNSNVNDFSNNSSFKNIDYNNLMRYPSNNINNSFQSSGNVREKLKLYDNKNSSSNFQLFTSNKTTNNNSLLIESSKTKTTILDIDSLNDKSKVQNTVDLNSKIKSNSNIDVVNNTMDYFNERSKSSFIQQQVQSKSFTFKNRNLNLGHDYSNKFSKNK